MSMISANLSSLALETFAGVELDLLTRASPLIPFAPTPVHISPINQILLKHGTVIASLVVFIYDYLCTLDQEVACIWSRPWSFATYLFFFNRYLPFVDLSLSFSAIQTFLTPQECLHRYSLITWLNVLGVSIAQIILTLRTIAIWNRNRWIVAILGVVFFARLAMSTLGSKLYLDSLIFIPASRLFFFGCVLIDSNIATVINFSAVFTQETIIVLLTLIRARKYLRRSNSSWVRQLYKSGYLFYFYLIAINSLDVIFPIIAPVPLRTTFTDPQRALHSMLCTRVIFLVLSPKGERDPYSWDSNGVDGRRPSRLSRRRSELEGRTVFSTIINTFVTDDGFDGPSMSSDVESITQEAQ